MSLPLKSRKGCLRCRLRRKKCGEEHPVCQNCRRNNMNCIWPGLDDDIIIHFLPSNQRLASLSVSLRSHSEVCNYVVSSVSQGYLTYPRLSPDPGYPPLRNVTEHRLIETLVGFLTMLMAPQIQPSKPDHRHVFGAALKEPWIRDTLLAFSAFVSSARDESLRTIAYRYYSSSIQQVQQRIGDQIDATRREELLIATLFLGMFEVKASRDQRDRMD